MFFHEVRIWMRAGLFTALLVATCWSSADANCDIQTAREASSFLCTEPVQFAVTSSLPRQQVAWSVVDYYGDSRAEGVVQMGGGAVTLRITPQPGVGYYTLALQWESGERHEKVFCVLPHPDAARGDGGLFGIGGSSTHDWFWDALWQMGARHCRTEFAWTSVEAEKGRYDLDWVRNVAEQAQRHNMQMTVLTGHTAYHYGVKPLDADGRVADKAYTWQPEGTIEWYNFIDAMAKTLVPRRLPAQPAEPTDTIARTGRPLIRAWEVWSEADQNFYYGSWNRYMDMLRIAYCTVKRQGRVPIVYGSCGHMTEMKYTIQSGVADHLDRIAYHPYHEDPQWMMMHWYRNMPQALAEVGMLRDSALTECGFHPPDGGATEEGFMPRVYATLKSLDEDLFVRAQCLGGVFPGRDTPNALAVQVDGELVPRPAYVAFAVTRWLLESAQYVGPLDAPEGARMELFVRQGSPMVVGWTTEGTRRVQLEISPSGRMMDALGTVTALSGPTASIDLTPNAVAILDVSFDEFARAASAGLEMLLATELGHECPTDSRWLQSLEDDLRACVGAGAADQLRRSVDDACDCVLLRAPHGPAAFYETQRLVGELMLGVAAVARDTGNLKPIHTNTIWRLAKMAERLGGIADGLGARWRRMNMVSGADVQKINSQISNIRSRVMATTQGRECPFADRLLDRALDSLDEVRRGGGYARGAWWAATVNARVAHSLTAVEKPIMRRVFVAVNFTSADIITKGVLLRPMPEHTLEARVYNFMPEDVTGRVSATLPAEWGGERPDGTFVAPAGGVSEPFDLEFSVPDEPRPWVRRDLGRFEWQDIKVDAPPTAQLRQLVNLSGNMSLGPLEPLIYRVFIGAYPSAAEPAHDTPMSILPIRPPGRERISWALQPAIVR